MARITSAEFEATLTRELSQRDSRRRARLGDGVALGAADREFIRAVMRAAGYDVPEEDRADRRAARVAKISEAAAFGDDQ